MAAAPTDGLAALEAHDAFIGRHIGTSTADQATMLTALVPALGQNVLDGGMQPAQAFEIIDYALARALPDEPVSPGGGTR